MTTDNKQFNQSKDVEKGKIEQKINEENKCEIEGESNKQQFSILF